MSGLAMSEPLSSTEIEDVLSSIRRLVSEDMRPVPRSVASAPQAAAGEKLILTPALRVVDPAPAPAAPRLHLHFPSEATPAPTDQPSNEAASIETVLASVGAAVDAGQGDWEDEADSLEAPHWGFGEEVLHQEPNAEFEVIEARGASESVPAWAQTDAEDDAFDQVAEEPARANVDPLWAAAAEASVIAALAEDAARGPTAAQETYAEETDDFRFNEDVLRELVRDILREELAGSMGERITRNIRKLVRAEIARGLASQELS